MSIYIHFKKTNRTFDNVRSAQNHARHNYDSMEDAYCDAYNISVENKPKCIYCNGTSEFISLGKGYHTRCSSSACKKINIVKGNRGIANRVREKVINNTEFHNYVLRNSDFYKNIIKENKPYYDEFLKKKFTNPSSQLRYYVNRADCNIWCKCVLTDKEYSVNVFLSESNIDYYFSPEYGTRTYRKYFNREEALKILEIRECYDLSDMTCDEFIKRIGDKYSYKIIRLIANYVYGATLPRNTPKSKPKTIRQPDVTICGVDLYSVRCSKTKQIRDILLNNKLTLSDINKIHSSSISICKECKAEYVKDRVYINVHTGNIYTRPLKNEHACSQKCYFSLLKYRKAELYYELTQEAREKHSKTMHDKISRGEFTPAVTNSWCKSRIDTKDGLIHFRSTWEAVYYSISTFNNINLIYEKIRIKYYDPILKKYRNYVVDFVDEENKVLYEVKPNGEKSCARTKAKELAAIEWATTNGYDFKYISDEWFRRNSIDIIEKTLYYCSIDQETLVRRMKQFLIN